MHLNHRNYKCRVINVQVYGDPPARTERRMHISRSFLFEGKKIEPISIISSILEDL